MHSPECQCEQHQWLIGNAGGIVVTGYYSSDRDLSWFRVMLGFAMREGIKMNLEYVNWLRNPIDHVFVSILFQFQKLSPQRHASTLECQAFMGLHP